MRMNGFANIHRIASHLNGKTNFANQITSVGPDNAAAENAVIIFVEQKLGDTLVATISDGPA